MATLVTPEKIAAMSTDARATLYANCMRTVDNEDAVFIVEMIVESGLPYARKKELSHGAECAPRLIRECARHKRAARRCAGDFAAGVIERCRQELRIFIGQRHGNHFAVYSSSGSTRSILKKARKAMPEGSVAGRRQRSKAGY